MYKLFYDLFPEIAERESRSLHVRDDGEEGDLPAGNYLFLELYCTDPDCDCQRVLLSVTERRLGIVATISYGFNPAQFPGFFDDLEPFLEPLNHQSQFAEELLAMFKEIVLDDEYEERLKRHYHLVKSAVQSPRASSGRQTGGVTSPRVESARQRRKQQKDARRKNRLR
jgi:hypothetical protein